MEILLVVGVGTCRGAVHKRTCRIEHGLAQNRVGGAPGETVLVGAVGHLTRGSVLPVIRQKLSRANQVLFYLVGRFMVAKARITQLLVGGKRLRDVRHASPDADDVEMQYRPQHQCLPFDKIALFLNIHIAVRGFQHVKMLKGDVGLTDSEPAPFPVAETGGAVVASLRPWVRVVPVIAAQILLGIEIDLVDVVERTVIVGDVVDVPCLGGNHIIGKIERAVGDGVVHAVICVLYVPLELLEGAEYVLLGQSGVGRLVQIVAARDRGQAAG